MEAIVRLLSVVTFCSTVCLCPLQGYAAHSARTQNFIVSAPTRALANEIAHEAERFRRDLAISWLGHELPAWRDPCPVRAQVDARLGAGGVTSFLFETEQRQFARPVGDGLFQARPAGRPFGWEMALQGSRERILDSVLPHEVTHTIFATHFGRPLPRWADEGACTTVEHDSEKAKQHRMLYEFLTTERGIAFNEMFAMTEYPKDMLPLYSQGFSLARFLIQQGGRRKFVDYIGEGLQTNDWTATTHQHYGFDSISDLQVTWLSWVRGGGQDLPNHTATPTLVASNTPARGSAQSSPSRTRSSWTLIPNDRKAKPRAKSSGGDGRFESGGSWYAKQKTEATSEADPPVSKGNFTRVATRPNRNEEHREVLLEWGEPREFLNPSLAPRRSGYAPK